MPLEQPPAPPYPCTDEARDAFYDTVRHLEYSDMSDAQLDEYRFYSRDYRGNAGPAGSVARSVLRDIEREMFRREPGRPIEVHTWPPRPEDGVPWRVTVLDVSENPNDLMGMGLDAATALADARENVARYLAVEDSLQLRFFGSGRQERSAVRAEARLQRRIGNWTAAHSL